MLIYFDVTGPARVSRIRVDLPDDGEHGWGWTFDADTDGRENRAVAVKPVVNGDWAFSVEATDVRGCTVRLLNPSFYRVRVDF